MKIKQGHHIHQFPKLELAKLINLIFKVSFFGSVVITPFIYKEVAIAIIVLFIIYISLFVEIKSESKNKSKTIDHKIENIKILEPNPPASQSFPQGATPPQDPQKKATLTEILEKAKSSGNEKLAKRILNFQNVFNSFQGQIDFDKVDLK